MLRLSVPPQGVDFLARLAEAEARDTQRSQPTGFTESSRRRKLTFHPNVVTRVEAACIGADRAIPTTPTTPYSQEEEMQTLSRVMTKMHLREASKSGDDTRRHFNAAAADAAWRRADALRAEIEGESSEESEQMIRERQREAARRCQQQAAMPPVSRPPLAPVAAQRGQLHRPPSGGKPPSQRGPPRSSSPRRGPSPRPTSTRSHRSSPRPPSPGRCPPSAPRSSTRVVAPPGGGSSLVLG